MRILISNDDGVHAPGIQSLNSKLSEKFNTVVVAPLEERSTTGHTMTLDSPLRLVEIDKNIFGCSGYPADCAVMGYSYVMKDERPDIVISGINRGANLGQDVYYSGTVAAAREGVFRGVPGIAVSLVVDFENPDEHHYYESASKFIEFILESNVLDKISPFTVLNINVPNLPYEKIKGVKYSELGFRDYGEYVEKRYDFRNRPYFWIGGSYRGHSNDLNSDCSAVDEGFISISLLNLVGNIAEKEHNLEEILNKKF